MLENREILKKTLPSVFEKLKVRLVAGNAMRLTLSFLSALPLHDISENRRGFVNKVERKLGALKSMLEFRSIDEVLNFGLHEFINSLQGDINQVIDAIHDTFFF